MKKLIHDARVAQIMSVFGGVLTFIILRTFSDDILKLVCVAPIGAAVTIALIDVITGVSSERKILFMMCAIFSVILYYFIAVCTNAESLHFLTLAIFIIVSKILLVFSLILIAYLEVNGRDSKYRLLNKGAKFHIYLGYLMTLLPAPAIAYWLATLAMNAK